MYIHIEDQTYLDSEKFLVACTLCQKIYLLSASNMQWGYMGLDKSSVQVSFLYMFDL